MIDVFWILVTAIGGAVLAKTLIRKSDPLPRAISRPCANDIGGGDTGAGMRCVAPFPLLRSSDPFDEDGNLIWRTQIPALRAVCEHEPIGSPCGDLRPIYASLARKYPEMYDGRTFQQWGQTFIDLDLLRVVGQSVHITAAGRALYGLLVQQSQECGGDIAPQWTARLND